MAQIWIILCSSVLRVQWTEHASSVQLKSKALILFMKHEQTYQSSQNECVLCMAHGSSNTNIKTFNVFNILNSIKWLIGTIYFMKRKKSEKYRRKKVHATPLIQCVHAWVNAFANLHVTYQICNCWMLQALKWLASVQ